MSGPLKVFRVTCSRDRRQRAAVEGAVERDDAISLGWPVTN